MFFLNNLNCHEKNINILHFVNNLKITMCMCVCCAQEKRELEKMFKRKYEEDRLILKFVEAPSEIN